MTPAARTLLTDLARTQYGQLSVWQARTIGITDHQLGDAVASGELERVRRGVVRVAGAPVDWRTELHADVLSVPGGAWAARGAALRLLGVRQRLVPYTRAIMTTGGGVPDVAEGTTVHRTRDLPGQDRTERLGIPCTSLGRTLVDLTPGLEWVDAVTLADQALCHLPGARGEVHEAAQRLRPGRAGVSRLARITAPDARGTFRSWLERQAAPLLAHAGITDARFNVEVPGLPEVGVVDCFSAAHWLVVEWKGLAFHRRPEDLQRDSVKQNGAVAAGLAALSFTWTDVVRRAPQVVDVLTRTTRRRRSA